MRVSYHYSVGNDGVVARHVAENNQAWHAAGHNVDSIGVALSNSSAGGQWLVSQRSVDLAVELLRDIARRNNLLPLRVGVNFFGHRDLSATACPGSHLHGRMREIADRVNASAATTPAAPAASRYRLRAILRQGSKGNDVRELQRRLNTLRHAGANGRPLTVDGNFGANTAHAVRVFQRANNLHADGVVGQNTARALGWNWQP